MSAAKLEKLVDLIINEDTAKAEQLFHEIVVEKSRQIYENIMMEEPTGDLMNEIEMEEEGMEGMAEAEEDFEDEEMMAGDFEADDEEGMGDEEDMDMDDEGMDDEEGMDMDDEGTEEEDLEDRVVDLEDKIDELLARFEEEMGADDEELGDEEEEEGEEEEEEGEEEEEESGLMEDIKLTQVPGLYGNKIGGDDGAQQKSPGLQNPSRVGTGAAPVKFSNNPESVPKGPQAPSNAYAKGETKVPGAGSFGNEPGKKHIKGHSAPKPVHKETETRSKSPVAESRRTKSKRV